MFCTVRLERQFLFVGKIQVRKKARKSLRSKSCYVNVLRCVQSNAHAILQIEALAASSVKDEKKALKARPWKALC
jgi:hypothetical protein